jgi:hypothetical protein
MNTINIYNKGFNTSLTVSTFVLTDINTITNTITFRKINNSSGAMSSANTTITIQKDPVINFMVNNKK